LLQAPMTLDQLLSGLEASQQAEGRELLRDLFARGIIADLSRSPVQQYLGYTFAGETALEQRSVGLVGSGPIGVRIAQSLLLHGVRRLVLLDDRPPDKLWTSFLPPGHAAIGTSSRSSSEALRGVLAAAGHTDVEALPGTFQPAALEAVIHKVDLLVVALEQPNLRLAHFVNRLCIRHRKPWMLATIDGNFGLVGPLFLPVHTACYNDYQVLVEAATPSPAMARKHRQHIERRVVGSFFPGLPAYAEILAGYSTLAVVNFLLRDTSFALGRVMVIDFDRMAIDVEDVLKLPRCPVCARERPAYRPPFGPDLVSRPEGAAADMPPTG
jgi:bacteriocin biosynthesis cyclodehydratase domain-containing protein